MAHEFHRPVSAPSRRPNTERERQDAACGQVIAFVVAVDPHVRVDVKSALQAAKAARFPAVFVLACPQWASAAIEAVSTTPARKSTLIQAVEYDAQRAAAIPDGADAELLGISLDLLKTMHAIAESVLDTYDSVLVIDAAQDAPDEGHLRKLCLVKGRKTEADVMASRAGETRTLPALLMRSFLDNAEPQGLDQANILDVD